jgi:hypothetical protein
MGVLVTGRNSNEVVTTSTGVEAASIYSNEVVITSSGVGVTSI